MRIISLLLACLALVSAKHAHQHIPSKPIHTQPTAHVPTTHHHTHHHHQPTTTTLHKLHPDTPNEDVYLVNGIPTGGYGRNNGSWVYYIFNIPTQSRAAIQTSVTPLFGDPTLYISCDARPTLTNYTWMATPVADTDVIVITRTDLDTKCVSGHMYIGIYTSAPSDFQVESNTLDVLIQLQDGVAQTGIAGPTATYYQYTITGNLTTSSDTLVQVTPIVGIPTLYVQCGGVPTMSSYKWVSRAESGLQTIRIAPQQLCTDQVLWIGIYSSPASDPSSFEVTVTSGAVATELSGGKVIRGGNDAGQYTDYTYNFLVGSTLSIEATVIYGTTMTIYAACNYSPRSTQYIWSASVTEAGSIELKINFNDINYCQSGLIYVSTTSSNQHSYVMVATSSFDIHMSETITLVNGYSLYDKLKAGQLNFYSIAIPSGAINFATTFLNGNGDVYISCTNTHPSALSYDYTGEFLQLDHLSSTTCATLYISITANFDTSYLILGYHPTSTVQLLDGVKQQDIIYAGKTSYYQLNTNQNKGVSVSVLSLSDAAKQLEYAFYISCTIQHPSASINTWSSQGGLNQNQQIIISSTDANICTQYYIAVVAYIHNTEPLQFIISGVANAK